MANENQTGAVATQQKKQTPTNILTSMVNAPSVQEQFRNALGEHKDMFVASLIDLYTGDTALQTCKPSLVVAEALRAATLKLPLNKALGFAYIVVFNNSKKVINPQTGREEWIKVPTPTFVPGYKGYIQLAMRTGQYRNINAGVVYEGELRNVNKLSGEIDFNGEKISDKVVGYFAYFELLNGFTKTLYMSVEDMAKYAKKYAPSIAKKTTIEELVKRANSTSDTRQNGWDNFNTMAVKTVLRQLLSHYGYLSVEMQGTLSKDIEVSNYSNSETNRDIIIQETEIKEVKIDGLDIPEAPKVEDAKAHEAPTNEAPIEELFDNEEPGY